MRDDDGIDQKLDRNGLNYRHWQWTQLFMERHEKSRATKFGDKTHTNPSSEGQIAARWRLCLFALHDVVACRFEWYQLRLHLGFFNDGPPKCQTWREKRKSLNLYRELLHKATGRFRFLAFHEQSVQQMMFFGLFKICVCQECSQDIMEVSSKLPVKTPSTFGFCTPTLP